MKPPLQRTEYPMFIFDEGSHPSGYFDCLDGEARSDVTTQRTVHVDIKKNKKHKRKKGKQARQQSTGEEYVVVD